MTENSNLNLQKLENYFVENQIQILYFTKKELIFQIQFMTIIFKKLKF